MSGWSAREVAEAVGVSEQAVRKALAAGRLTGSRGPDGSWVIDPDDVRRWQATRERGREFPRTSSPTPAPSPAVTGPVASETTLVPALRALLKSHEDLLQVVRDLVDEVDRASRAGSGATGPTAAATTRASARRSPA